MNKSVFRSIGVLYRTYLSYADEFLKGTGVSFSESVIITNVGMNEGTNQEEIAKSLYIDRAAIARNVKSLSEKQLLNIKKNSQDKRAKALYLTAKGKELYDYITKMNMDRLEKLYSGINAEELNIFLETFNKIEENLR